MFELRCNQASLFKKTIDAIKDLVEEANFDVNSSGFSLQAMDSSHVSLVALSLRSDGFEHFRADRAISMGIKLTNFSKILKCAGNDDAITMRSEDQGDTITFIFESPNQERLSEFDLKLMDIDSEHLGIPDNEYDATFKLPSSEFARIVKDLSSIGDTVEISVTKDAVKFSTNGDIGSANIMCRQSKSVEKEEDAIEIDVTEPVALTFALRYLNSFAKATPLSGQTVFKLSKELPIVVEYRMPDVGQLAFYLAPKIEEDEMA